MPEHQEESGNVEPSLVPGAQAAGQSAGQDLADQDRDWDLISKGCLHDAVPEDEAAEHVFSLDSEGLLDMKFDLSSIYKNYNRMDTKNNSMLYKPMVTIQGMGIKMQSQLMDAESTSELLGSLSEMMVTTGPAEAVNKSLQGSTVHCQVTCVEGWIQLVFRFFVVGKPQDAASTERVPRPIELGCRVASASDADEVVVTAEGVQVGGSKTSEDSNSEISRKDGCNGGNSIDDEELSSHAKPVDASSSTADSTGSITYRHAAHAHESVGAHGSEIKCMPLNQQRSSTPAIQVTKGSKDRGGVTKCCPAGTHAPALMQNKHRMVHTVLLLFQLMSCSIFAWRAWGIDDQQHNFIQNNIVRLFLPWVPILVFWHRSERFSKKLSAVVRRLRLLVMVVAVLGLLTPKSVFPRRLAPARGWQMLLEAIAFPLVLRSTGQCELEVLNGGLHAAQGFSQAILYPLCYQVSLLDTFILGGLEAALLVLVGVFVQSPAVEAPPPLMALVSFAISCAAVNFDDRLNRWILSRRLVHHN